MVSETCAACDGQGGTDGYDQSGEPTHGKATCTVCKGTGEVSTNPSSDAGISDPIGMPTEPQRRQVHEGLARMRLEAACAQAEGEFLHLAAPDGTVAVQFTDLRALLTCIDESERQKQVAGDALKPFAVPHAMGDNYVQFAPRLIKSAREALIVLGGLE